MSDTSTLSAIKIYGQMVELPKDSSVSWNDLEDKPIIIDTSTQTVRHYYDIVSYLPINDLKQSGDGFGDSYQGNKLYVLKDSITTAANTLSSLLSDDLKNIWKITWYDHDADWYIEAIIDIDNEEVLNFSNNYNDDLITLRSDNLGDDGYYWLILVNDSLDLLDDDHSVTAEIIPVNFITSDNQTVTSLSYTETITVPGQWYFDPDHIKEDASLGILWDSSVNYYTKTQADNKFLQSNDISTFITSNDISTFITSNDVSNFITDNDISTFITSNDVSNFVTDNDVSTFITSNDVSTFAKIQYISLTDYDNLSVKDPNTLYIIPA